MTRALFLDRDGVINSVRVKGNKPFSPRKISELKILPFVPRALDESKKLGLLNIVITNQPDIVRKKMPLSELEKIHAYLRQKLPIDDIFVCPHDDRDNCNCRKPRPGLFLKAAEKWKIDLKGSFVVGDSRKDILAAKKVDCVAFLIKAKYNREDKISADYEVNDLLLAVEIIKKLF